jgi:hypothetical protein
MLRGRRGPRCSSSFSTVQGVGVVNHVICACRAIQPVNFASSSADMRLAGCCAPNRKVLALLEKGGERAPKRRGGERTMTMVEQPVAQRS